MKIPQYPDLKFVDIENFKTGETCQLWRVDKMSITEDDYEQIRKICNEAAVYDFLFREKLEGKPYPIEKAKGFIDWATKGWTENTHFVFIVRNPEGKIVAAVDTKSNDLAGAEIGYWASEDYPGIMTNAVKAMIEINKRAGFKSVWARVKKDNEKSCGVQERAGLKYDSNFTNDNKEYRKYILKLE